MASRDHMPGTIEEANPDERRRSRIAHRTGVAVCVLLLLGAVIGLLGKGPVSKVTLRSPDNVAVEHHRFVHYEGPVELTIDIPPAATRDGVIHLSLSRSFVEKVEIKRVDPQPEVERAGAQFVTYTIRAETNAATRVIVKFSAQHYGTLEFAVGVDELQPVALSHFAYP